MTESQVWQRQLQLAQSGGRCEVCGGVLRQTQGAHRIANTEQNRKKWGSWIIDHPLNIAIVCSLACNQLCNIGHNPGACLDLVEKILTAEKRKFKK